MKIIKKVANVLWETLCAIGMAKHAAELARNGKWEEAQAFYRK